MDGLESRSSGLIVACWHPHKRGTLQYASRCAAVAILAVLFIQNPLRDIPHSRSRHSLLRASPEGAHMAPPTCIGDVVCRAETTRKCPVSNPWRAILLCPPARLQAKIAGLALKEVWWVLWNRACGPSPAAQQERRVAEPATRYRARAPREAALRPRRERADRGIEHKRYCEPHCWRNPQLRHGLSLLTKRSQTRPWTPVRID